MAADSHIAKPDILTYSFSPASFTRGYVMSKDPDPKSGRVTFDERGRSTWEWRIDTGTFSRDIDTQRLRQLQAETAVTLKEEVAPPVGVDPYSASEPLAPQKTPRRTLDDMRKLSEEIKRSRERK
jgi:hypothetical protein